MAFKTILSVIGMNQGNRDLELAVDICRAADAHLSVLIVSPAASVPIGTYADVVSDAWYEERQRESRKLKVRTEDVTKFVDGSGLSCDIVSEHVEAALIGDVIGRRARYADLTLAGPSLIADETISDGALDGVLFRSGRPAMFVPEKQPVTLKPQRVTIAWDGSLEAARAANLATGILENAEDVRIVVVDPSPGEAGHGAEPGADLAAYLARHGVKLTVERLPSSGMAIADVLMQHAADNRTELLVMGAYGHSRLRERIFGGVTRTMLNRITVPVFMAH